MRRATKKQIAAYAAITALEFSVRTTVRTLKFAARVSVRTLKFAARVSVRALVFTARAGVHAVRAWRAWWEWRAPDRWRAHLPSNALPPATWPAEADENGKPLSLPEFGYACSRIARERDGLPY